MSFQINIFRSGLEHDPNGPNDPGVLAGKATIDKVSSSSTDATIVQNLESEFETEFGAGTVTVRSSPMRYIWVWDDVNEVWASMCIESSELTINDGGTAPLIVEVDVTT